MVKYCKKPIVVEAFQYFDNMGNYTYQIPVWFNKAILDNIIYVKNNKTFIKTLEGDMEISNGDWIIKEPFPINGRNIYPCKSDIFKKTYEKIE